IAIGVVLVILVCGYYAYQIQAEETARREAAQIRQRDIAQRKLELATAVNTAINARLPARITVPAYLETTSNIPRSLAGWRLAKVECAGPGCTLTYKAQAFATWAGYMKAKPAEWPAPTFDGDIEKVTQPIPVPFPPSAPRAADTLPQREKVRMDLGNLAQVSKTIGLIITLPNAWQRVAGNPAVSSPDEQWVPMLGAFNATGSSVLLSDLVKRLPEVADVTTVTFELNEKLNFDLKGNVYANP
uniref:type 4b pilus protein PilO2 n=1 Tax=Pseudomonas sp. G(2018) TaxID=2502242 RepID=UPI00148531CA